MPSLFSSKKKNLGRVRELQSLFASRISVSGVPGNDGAAPAVPTGKLPGEGLLGRFHCWKLVCIHS